MSRRKKHNKKVFVLCTGELGYDGLLYDGFLQMADDMLGPSSMHIKYSSYVYDGFCIWRTDFPGPIESIISNFTWIIDQKVSFFYLILLKIIYWYFKILWQQKELNFKWFLIRLRNQNTTFLQTGYFTLLTIVSLASTHLSRESAKALLLLVSIRNPLARPQWISSWKCSSLGSGWWRN